MDDQSEIVSPEGPASFGLLQQFAAEDLANVLNNAGAEFTFVSPPHRDLETQNNNRINRLLLESWDEDAVCGWLGNTNTVQRWPLLRGQVDNLQKEFKRNHVCGRHLSRLDRQDLKDMGIDAIGLRLELLMAFEELSQFHRVGPVRTTEQTLRSNSPTPVSVVRAQQPQASLTSSFQALLHIPGLHPLTFVIIFLTFLPRSRKSSPYHSVTDQSDHQGHRPIFDIAEKPILCASDGLS